MADQASLGYVAQGREGTGEAQIYNSQPLTQQFTNYATNYLQQKQEKEKLDAANKREDEQEAIKEFKSNYAYTAKTWSPFQELITQKEKGVKDNLQQAITKLGGVQNFKVGSPEWVENQNLQDEATALAAKGMDYKAKTDEITKNVIEDKSGEMDTDGQVKELMELQNKNYTSLNDFNLEKLTEIKTGDRHIKLDGVFENGMKTVQEIMTADLKEIPDGAYKTKLIEQKKKISPFLKTKLDATGNTVLDNDPVTGKPQIDIENPAFMDWVESQPRAVKSLNYKIQEAAKAGQLDLNDKEAVAKFRKETAAKYALNLQKNDVSNSVKTGTDKTETQGEKLGRQQRASQFAEEMAFKKDQAANKGAGKAPASAAAINDLAAFFNKDSNRFTATEVIGGRTYRVADASNPFGGKLEKTTAADGRKLARILIDAETGQLKYVDSKDDTNPKDLPEDDFSLLDNLLQSNLDKDERKATIEWLENYKIDDGKGGFISAYDKKTGKMNWKVFNDTTIGKTGTGFDEQTLEATKTELGRKVTNETTKQFVARTQKLLTNYKGKAELDYKGEKYTDVEIDYEGDVEGAGDDIRLYGKDKNGNKVEIGTNMFKDIKQEDIPKILEGFKFKGESQEPAKQEQKTGSKTEAPKTTGLKVKPKRQE